MATPGFGFSFGDFVQAISLLNEARKALRDTGGAKDDFKHVLVDLQHLEILLEQLNHGTWDHGDDAGHLNAVKSMALTCKVPLREFLTKMGKYKVFQSEQLRGFKAKIGSNARKIQWAVKMSDEVEKFRAVIAAKVVSINTLIQLHVASKLSKLETRAIAVENSLNFSQKQFLQSQEAIARTAAEQMAVRRSVSDLVQICTGTKVGVEDFRRLSKLQLTEVRHRLSRIEQMQSRGLLAIFRTSREVVSNISLVESALKQLLRLFGGFSVAALNLLQHILQKDLEIYALLYEIESRLPRGPTPAVNSSRYVPSGYSSEEASSGKQISFTSEFESRGEEFEWFEPPELLQDDPSDLDSFKAINIQTTNEKPREDKPHEQLFQNFREQAYTYYSDELLEYFMFQGRSLPDLPPNFEPNWYIDADRHTALHWASAMGDLEVIKQMKSLGADLESRNIRGETPLMRAVLFSNCMDNGTMPAVFEELISTTGAVDSRQATVLHHAAANTISPGNKKLSWYYLQVILRQLQRKAKQDDFQRLLDAKDIDGNTAIHIAAKQKAHQCIEELLEHGASTDIKNYNGVTANYLIQELKGSVSALVWTKTMS